MKYVVTIVAILSGSLLLIGCGGSADNKTQSVMEQLQSKDKIIVFYNYPPQKCMDPRLIEIFTNKGFKNVTATVSSDDVSCAVTFNRTQTSRCEEAYANQDFSESCVVGYDRN